MQTVDAKDWIVRQVIATAELSGQEITAAAAAMMAEDLESYPQDVLEKAFRALRMDGARLTLKSILDRIDESAGRLAPSEAWAIAVKAFDETATVVWSNEIRQAHAVAAPIARKGDMIGARMAFIAAYERMVREAREQHKMPAVSISLGWDEGGRDESVRQAMESGYLPRITGQQYLEGPAKEKGSVGSLDTLKKLIQLRRKVAEDQARKRIEKDEARNAALAAQREELDALKALASHRVAARAAGAPCAQPQAGKAGSSGAAS